MSRPLAVSSDVPPTASQHSFSSRPLDSRVFSKPQKLQRSRSATARCSMSRACNMLTPETVFLNVFDILPVSFTAPTSYDVLHLLGVCHTAVEVYGEEWYFSSRPHDGVPPDGGTGIRLSASPRRVSLSYRFSIACGQTKLQRYEVHDMMISELADQWPCSRYDLIRCNCNHFSETLLALLGVGPVSFLHFTGACHLGCHNTETREKTHVPSNELKEEQCLVTMVQAEAEIEALLGKLCGQAVGQDTYFQSKKREYLMDEPLHFLSMGRRSASQTNQAATKLRRAIGGAEALNDDLPQLAHERVSKSLTCHEPNANVRKKESSIGIEAFRNSFDLESEESASESDGVNFPFPDKCDMASALGNSTTVWV